MNVQRNYTLFTAHFVTFPKLPADRSLTNDGLETSSEQVG